jgi:hypothetical protein
VGRLPHPGLTRRRHAVAMCRPRPETSDQTLYAQRPVLVGVDASDIGLGPVDVPEGGAARHSPLVRGAL